MSTSGSDVSISGRRYSASTGNPTRHGAFTAQRGGIAYSGFFTADVFDTWLMRYHPLCDMEERNRPPRDAEHGNAPRSTVKEKIRRSSTGCAKARYEQAQDRYGSFETRRVEDSSEDSPTSVFHWGPITTAGTHLFAPWWRAQYAWPQQAEKIGYFAPTCVVPAITRPSFTTTLRRCRCADRLRDRWRHEVQRFYGLYPEQTRRRRTGHHAPRTGVPPGISNKLGRASSF